LVQGHRFVDAGLFTPASFPPQNDLLVAQSLQQLARNLDTRLIFVDVQTQVALNLNSILEGLPFERDDPLVGLSILVTRRGSNEGNRLEENGVV